jgi:hypothetical protein
LLVTVTIIIISINTNTIPSTFKRRGGARGEHEQPQWAECGHEWTNIMKEESEEKIRTTRRTIHDHVMAAFLLLCRGKKRTRTFIFIFKLS